MRIHRNARAEEDLIGIWCYVAADSERAADRLLDRLEARWSALAQHPFLGRAYGDIGSDVRGLVEGEYLILYRMAEERIDILRVLHGRRDISGDDMES